jgi:hypothetical protein
VKRLCIGIFNWLRVDALCETAQELGGFITRLRTSFLEKTLDCKKCWRFFSGLLVALLSRAKQYYEKLTAKLRALRAEDPCIPVDDQLLLVGEPGAIQIRHSDIDAIIVGPINLTVRKIGFDIGIRLRE